MQWYADFIDELEHKKIVNLSHLYGYLYRWLLRCYFLFNASY